MSPRIGEEPVSQTAPTVDPLLRRVGMPGQEGKSSAAVDTILQQPDDRMRVADRPQRDRVCVYRQRRCRSTDVPRSWSRCHSSHEVSAVAARTSIPLAFRRVST
jgi:hypothetical protein